MRISREGTLTIANYVMDRSENPFLYTIRLPVKPPKIMVKILVFAYLLAIYSLWISAIDILFKLMLTLLPIFSLIRLYNNHNTVASDDAVVELILGTEDDWQIKFENREVQNAVLADSLFVHPLLTIILLRYKACEKYFIFTPENIDADVFRRLRVRLRFPLESGQ